MKWTNTFSVAIIFITGFLILSYQSNLNYLHGEENKNTIFANVSINHPYYHAIEFARERGWININENRHFLPDEPIEKGEFINIITNALSSTDSQDNTEKHIQDLYKRYFESKESLRYDEALKILLLGKGLHSESNPEFDSDEPYIKLTEKYRFYIPRNSDLSYNFRKVLTRGEAVYLIRQIVTFYALDGRFAADYANKYWEDGYIGIGKFHCYCSVRDAGDCANFVSQAILAGLIKSSDGGEVYAARLKFQDRTGKYVWWFDGSYDNDKDGEVDLFQNITVSFETAWYQYQYLKNQACISSDPDHAPELIGMITEEIQTGGIPDVNQLQMGDIAFLRNEKTGETIHTMIVTEVPDHPTVHNVKINQRNIMAKFCQYDASEGGCPFGEETIYERVNNHLDSDSWYIYRVLGFRIKD